MTFKPAKPAWVTVVDKSGLPRMFKVWIYQHGILPRLLWPLLIYEVLGTIMEGFECNISQFLHRWPGRTRSLSIIALYGHTNKVTRAKEVLLYRDSSGNRVSSAGITVRT